MSRAERAAESQLNWGTIQTFVVDACGGDKEIVLQMVALYLKSAGDLLQEMEDGIASQDFPTVRRASHGLKSSSRMFSAESLALHCLAVEESAKSAQLEMINAHLPEIRSELVWLQSALPALCEEKMTAEK